LKKLSAQLGDFLHCWFDVSRCVRHEFSADWHFGGTAHFVAPPDGSNVAVETSVSM